MVQSLPGYFFFNQCLTYLQMVQSLPGFVQSCLTYLQMMQRLSGFVQSMLNIFADDATLNWVCSVNA